MLANKSRSLAKLGMTTALGMTIMAAGCRKAAEPDAYGNFEAEEVTVSSQATGELRAFTPVEGTHLDKGAVIGSVDTVQLSLELAQLMAQRGLRQVQDIRGGGHAAMLGDGSNEAKVPHVDSRRCHK